MVRHLVSMNTGCHLVSFLLSMALIFTISLSFSFQDLHRDIESHSQLIKTVLWQCGEIDAHRRQRRLRKFSKKSRQTSPSQELKDRISVLLSVGKIIEERWHCLWLRSLEWQCFLEQFTSGPKGRFDQVCTNITIIKNQSLLKI